MLGILVRVVLCALLVAPASALADTQAQAVVERSTRAVLEELRTNRERITGDPKYLTDLVDREIVPYLDFAAMTVLAVNQHWRAASASQREALVDAFSTLLLRTYTKSLTEFRDQRIEFLPNEPEDKPGRATVRSRYHPNSGDPVLVEYKLREKDGWKIYDIRIDGISLVTNYRATFDAEIRQAGIDGLIASLRRKNDELAR